MDNPLGVPLPPLSPVRLAGPIRLLDGTAPIEGAAGYEADLERGDFAVLEYSLATGALAGTAYLAADVLMEGTFLTVFRMVFQEGEGGPEATMAFGLLNQCQARLAVPVSFLSQNRRHFGRQGAWLNIRVSGARLDPRCVDRIRLLVTRRGDPRPRFWLTPWALRSGAPPALTDPLLPRGPLLDDMGQSTLMDWPGKSRRPAEVTRRLFRQLEDAPRCVWPEPFGRWGGWRDRSLPATGFFRTHHDGRRWWLVDPDGHPFWSAGLNCVSIHVASGYGGLEKALTFLPAHDGPYREAFTAPDPRTKAIDYLAVNLIRAFGPETWRARWSAVVLGLLRQMGINTVANWSDGPMAAAAGFPYVRWLQPRFTATPLIFRDLPDVFAESFEREAKEFAIPLKETVNDPALIGYFMMNEPTWGFSDYCIAEGMLLGPGGSATRQALCEHLRRRYATDAALTAAWGMPATFARLAEGSWEACFSPAARADLEAFSSVMAARFWATLSAACRAVDDRHLNLGVRYHRAPPDWATAGMECFDVFSMNCYRDILPADVIAPISRRLNRPILIGEYHFGSLDAGLPAPGLRLVASQADRARAFRCYQENAASQPWCVGTHYFTLYDQSALGRHDGENYQIGFVDVCHRPYDPLCAASRASSGRLYDVAAGLAAPYSEPAAHIVFRA